MLVFGMFGQGVAHELHFGKLMQAQQALRVSSRSPRFGTKAVCPRDITFRQVGFFHDLACVQTGQDGLCGRDQVSPIFGVEQVFVKLRQMP